MSTKGSHKRILNRDEKKLSENWSQVDWKVESKDSAKKRKETKISDTKTRITYG